MEKMPLTQAAPSNLQLAKTPPPPPSLAEKCEHAYLQKYGPAKGATSPAMMQLGGALLLIGRALMAKPLAGSEQKADRKEAQRVYHSAYKTPGSINPDGSKTSFFSKTTLMNMITSITQSLTVAPKIADVGETPVEPSLKGRNSHQTIKQDFVGRNGVKRGSEELHRVDVLNRRQLSLTEKLKDLHQKQENLKAEIQPGETKKLTNLKAIEKEIHACEHDLKNCEKALKADRDHNSSNTSRDVLEKNNFAEARNNNVPGAVNFRSQTVTTSLVSGEIKTETFQRFGAIWDPRNGLLNLKELSEFASAQKSSDPMEVFEAKGKIQSRIAELNDMKKKFTSKDQLVLIDESISHLQGLLSRPPSISEAFRNVENVIADRRRFLREQLLEPIVCQMKDNAAKMYEVQNGDSKEKVFPMFHLGLLTGTENSDFQASGWAHMEHNQIGDMAQIFNELQGCKIVVTDKEHSYFGVEDNDGNAILYLSKDDIAQPAAAVGEVPVPNLQVGETVTLSTCFMNVSVQGHNVNDGMQAEINKKAIEQLFSWTVNITDDAERTEVRNTLASLRTRLEDKKESSFGLATDIAMVARQLGALSEGCLSCKDRGGTIAEMIAIKIIETNLKNEAAKSKDPDLKKDPSLVEKEHQDIAKDSHKFTQEIFDENGACVKVVIDCTGVKCAKVDYRQVPGLDKINVARNSIGLGVKFVSGGLDVVPEKS